VRLRRTGRAPYPDPTRLALAEGPPGPRAGGEVRPGTANVASTTTFFPGLGVHLIPLPATPSGVALQPRPPAPASLQGPAGPCRACPAARAYNLLPGPVPRPVDQSLLSSVSSAITLSRFECWLLLRGLEDGGCGVRARVGVATLGDQLLLVLGRRLFRRMGVEQEFRWKNCRYVCG
jgi:hypothetical protein